MMWRAFLMAAGISLIIAGAEFMVVDRLVIADSASAAIATRDFASPTLSTYGSSVSGQKKVFVPPEWAPWGLLSGGVLLALYAASLSEGSGD